MKYRIWESFVFSQLEFILISFFIPSDTITLTLIGTKPFLSANNFSVSLKQILLSNQFILKSTK